MMRHTIPLLLASSALTLSCTSPLDEFRPELVIAREQAALDRWGKGDPDGFLEIMDESTSYFDPTTQTRLNGRDQVKGLIDIIRGRLQIDRAEMLNPTVVRVGDVAILTFNLISRGATFNGSPKSDVRWNSTEIYRWVGGEWKIVHSHWSYTAPKGGQL